MKRRKCLDEYLTSGYVRFIGVGSHTLGVRLLIFVHALTFGANVTFAEQSMEGNALLENRRPWCTGRLLFDRPAASEVTTEYYGYWGYAINVATGVSRGTYQHLVDSREKELRGNTRTTTISYKEMLQRGLKSMLLATNVPWLTTAVSPTKDSRLMIYKISDDDPAALLEREGYVLAGDTMLTIKSLVRSVDVDISIARSTDVYQRIVSLDDWVIPVDRGFCIKGALIGGPSRNSEMIEQNFNLMPGNFALFMLKMRNSVDVDQDSSLLKSLPELRSQLQQRGYGKNIRVLRDGRRRIADMNAEEVLFAIQEGEVTLYRFFLIAPGNPVSTAEPHTEIRMLLGQQPSADLAPSEATSPVDEATAIQTWDTLLDSIRLRPGAM